MTFRERMETLDRLEFAEGQEAESLRQELEGLNDSLFQGLREGIRTGAVPDFQALLREYVEPQKGRDEAGYEDLDAFVNGLLCAEPIPGESKTLEPEMVFYQKTPARVVVELVEKAGFTERDVFYDLGSGLGQIPLLVNLLSGVTAKGVEREPAYVRYSEQSAKSLGLAKVSFVEADVREADLSDGTVFFLYTPFTGRMLEDVLDKLRKLSTHREIRVFTYGPCTLDVARQPWLRAEEPEPLQPHRLGVFSGSSPA